MIISPPFLPAEGLRAPPEKWKTDPMMDVVDRFELTHSGVFPVAFDRRWHCGMHLAPFGGMGQLEPVRAIADGEVIAYRVAKRAISDGHRNPDTSEVLNSNIGFVLLRHVTDTGEGRTIKFHSLYMHLLDVISTNALEPQLNLPAIEGSPDVLPSWLLRETDGVQAGNGRKVYRGDRLGFVGRYQGETHMHFEIFMTEEDFSAFFDQRGQQVSLGESRTRTPASNDHWGHTYLVVPPGSAFASNPPGATGSPLFPPLQAGSLDANSTLYAESFFSKGERFIRAWIDKGNGKAVSLTPEPIRDPYTEYEYNLFERATTLYEACPSDGYELLRFGRVLSTDTPTLPADKRAAWVAIPFDEGKLGYLDINLPDVQKLSDARFPFFMGWQKIEGENSPFDQQGLCGHDTLCRVTGVEDRFGPIFSQLSHDERLAQYVRGNDDVRAKLKGFICHASSEWDASTNDARFRSLREPDGFFGKRKSIDPHGYENFLDFVRKSQFMAQVPFGEGKKFWFFHPTAFIRHFRKCGWLSRDEMFQLVPTSAMRPAVQRQWVSEKIAVIPSTIEAYRIALNHSARRYGIVTAPRMAAFYANAFQETMWFSALEEKENRHALQRYLPWQGRGFLQLTWPANYIRYWRFRGIHVSHSIEQTLNAAAQEADKTRSNVSLINVDPVLPADLRENRTAVGTSTMTSADSAGAYWAWSLCAKSADTTTANVKVQQAVQTKPGRTETKTYYSNESFGRVAATVNVGHPSLAYGSVNGIVARFQAYTTAQVALFDLAQFPTKAGMNKAVPEDFKPRRL